MSNIFTKNRDLINAEFSRFDEELKTYPKEMLELRQRIKQSTDGLGGLRKGEGNTWTITYADTMKNLKDTGHIIGVSEALNSMKEYISKNNIIFKVSPMSEKDSKALGKYVGDAMAELTGQDRWRGQ